MLTHQEDKETRDDALKKHIDKDEGLHGLSQGKEPI